jgi:hypothetical protein
MFASSNCRLFFSRYVFKLYAAIVDKSFRLISVVQGPLYVTVSLNKRRKNRMKVITLPKSTTRF